MILIAGTLPNGHTDADILILALDRIDETLAAIQSVSSQTGVSNHLFVLDQGSEPAGLRRLAEAVRACPARPCWRPAAIWAWPAGAT
jgi:hypothetical protein